MEFGYSDDQKELGALARRLFADLQPEPEVRRIMMTDDAHDPELWSAMAELGLLGLAVPVEVGGAGCGLTEVGVVAEQAGAALLCGPWFGHVVLATGALLASGDSDAAGRLLPALVSGERIATLAYVDSQANGTDLEDSRAKPAVARRSGGGWLISGTKHYVLNGAHAQEVLVVARTGEAPSLFRVDGAAPSVLATPLPALDLTRRLAHLRFDDTPAELIGREGGAGEVLDRVLDQAAAVLAMEQVGGMQRALDIAVGYAKVRYQFGRPIGGFQAIQHKCADMLVRVESARSAARYALWAAAGAPDEVAVAARIVASYCSEAFVAVTADTIQVHGGIGFTWEHPAHLYFKRARTDQALLGQPCEHRAALGQLIGI